MSLSLPRVAVAVTLAVALAPLAACGSESGGDTEPEGVVEVVAAFYPLEYVAERVGGPYVRVTNLTPAGAEPHDLELTAPDIARVGDADLVVYLAGFSPAVDDAVDPVADSHRLEAGDVAGLDRDGPEGNADPHFWLDPTKLATVAEAVADRLSALVPDAAAAIRANADALVADLTALDTEYRTALTGCRSTDLVTSHEAFGYLADRYGLTQVAVTGVTPDEEPTPADLAEVTRYVKAHGVQTVYAETLVSRDVADTIAAETGATVAVLDPLEGLADGAAGDFLAVMRVNLATLRQGQGCP